MKIEFLQEVDSTNNYIKKYLSGGEDCIVCAERQTGGKGTKGRSFLSQEGGVYLTALNFYRNMPADQAFRVMSHSAVAVCRTAADFGVRAQIKWANDVLVDGRKLCGILIENVVSGAQLRASVVGIGVNVNNDVSALNGIAVNLSEAAGRYLRTEEVRDCLIGHLQESDGFDEYLSYVSFLGRTVTVIEGQDSYRAIARRILPNGNLEVEQNGQRRILSAGEISLRLGEV